MTRIVVDEALRTKVGNLSEFVELCDDAGHVLAHVVPLPRSDDYELIEPPISEEELQRRERSGKWYTTEQVLEHLRGLE